jgi:hypothetical protein
VKKLGRKTLMTERVGLVVQTGRIHDCIISASPTGLAGMAVHTRAGVP